MYYPTQRHKMYRKLCFTLLIAAGVSACAHQPSVTQSTQNAMETKLIEATLMDYIDGTSIENPEQLNRAFHPDFNLYAVRKDGTLRVWDGQAYISNFTLGDTNSRVGKILSVDYEKDVAVAKAQILIPGRARYIDYFLLAKYEDQWRIIHKSYTSVPLETP